MSQETAYEFETLDAREILESPDLPKIIETLLNLYRTGVATWKSIN